MTFALDPSIAAAGALVGLVVGLTGMGGGALLTPLLVLCFGVDPLAAVSSDLVASLVMKPVGAAVHLRRRTVHRGIVRDLCLGSVPAAFAGVLLLRAFPDHRALAPALRIALGAVLLLAVAGTLVRQLLSSRAPRRELPLPARRPLATIAVGAAGGLLVGLTSVGSGSLIVVSLMLLFPQLSAAELVGTDLVQAVPLVAAAAVGHLFFGEVRLGLTASVLCGALPAVYLGARLSSAVPAPLVRGALSIVLFGSGLRLLGVPAGWVGSAVLLGGGALAAGLFFRRARRPPAPLAPGPLPSARK